MAQPADRRFVMEDRVAGHVTARLVEALEDPTSSAYLLVQAIAQAAGGASSWNDLEDKPTSFPPSGHEHAISQVTGLLAALSDRALKSETHSTRVFDPTTNTWPARATGYAYDVAVGPEMPEPVGALSGDIHEIQVDG